MSSLTITDIQKINQTRANRWHNGFPRNEDGWTGADWSNAMQGEAGEAGNVVKKLRRIEMGIQQAEQGAMSHIQMEDFLLEKLSKEIGDTYIYLDLLATHYNLDLEACVVYAFNQVSEREGFPERLATNGVQSALDKLTAVAQALIDEAKAGDHPSDSLVFLVNLLRQVGVNIDSKTHNPNPDALPVDGLYNKFAVHRMDGKDRPGGEKDGAQYFVLDYVHDDAAVPALAAYADAIEGTEPGLAEDLREIVDALTTDVR